MLVFVGTWDKADEGEAYTHIRKAEIANRHMGSWRISARRSGGDLLSAESVVFSEKIEAVIAAGLASGVFIEKADVIQPENGFVVVVRGDCRAISAKLDPLFDSMSSIDAIDKARAGLIARGFDEAEHLTNWEIAWLDHDVRRDYAEACMTMEDAWMGSLEVVHACRDAAERIVSDWLANRAERDLKIRVEALGEVFEDAG